MDCQKNQKSHFRHLFAFNRGEKTSETAEVNCPVHGEDAIAKKTAEIDLPNSNIMISTSTTLFAPEDKSRCMRTNSGIF